MPEALVSHKLGYLLAQQRSAAAAIAEELKDVSSRKGFAEAFCASVLGHIWDIKVRSKQRSWNLPDPPVDHGVLDAEIRDLAADTALLAAQLDFATSGFFLGTIYTALLPARVRTEWGVYYTPPPLVERLLSNVTNAGLDWTKARVIDPACGGAAFLAPAAVRMWRALSRTTLTPKGILDHISANLSGVEIDAFAAWMSQALTELRLLDLMVASSRRLRTIVRVGDALQSLVAESPVYDLVVGNPPYGKVQLSQGMKEHYGRSVYGHANLYGLFTDLALRITASLGIVAFVTPTSFLSGQYFKALRSILATESPPLTLDFVHQRDGVFEDVLQETVLVTFRKSRRGSSATKISTIDADRANGGVKVTSVTRFAIAQLGERPWLLPRNARQHDVLRGAMGMKSRLAHYGLAVATGQLVWNRHKDQLRSTPSARSLPLIWAESILPDGSFRFRALRANHKPYFELRSGQGYLVTAKECLLIQRTTAKEQHRRIICAILPNEFIQKNGAGVVVENHLNIVKQAEGLLPAAPLRAVCALLNSQAVDQVFRCISGSVAVSAYELNALPLPDPEQITQLDRLLQDSHTNGQEAEDFIAHLYGVR